MPGVGGGASGRAAGEAGPEESGRPARAAGERPPAVSPVSLYSYLVTRPTGRAVRLGIEQRLAEYDRQVLAVVDFGEVQLIDFSCADEVVVKLVLHSLREPIAGPRAFFLFTGMRAHHADPVASALRRRRLVAAAERAGGRPALLGVLPEPLARTWRALHRLGRAEAEAVARRLGGAGAATARRLAELHERRLLLRDGREYLSFRRALDEARPDPPAG